MTAQRTILLVDDDAELRAGLKAVLDKKGYRTLEADDGWQARQLVDTHAPDLVILDMMMPRWGGLAVLEHFRGKADAPAFIMITANTGTRHEAYAQELGVLDYIHKPFPLERLLESVGKAIPDAAPPRQATAAPEEFGLSVQCRCPACGSRIKTPVVLLGKTRNCPGCRHAFVLKMQPPEDVGAVLVTEDGKILRRS